MGSIRIAAIGLLAGTVLATQAGCGTSLWGLRNLRSWFGKPSPAPAVNASTLPVIDADSTELPWARDEEYFIVVSRPCRRLDVFHWGHLVGRYPVVFGRNPVGGKLYEGDRRTPTGFYTIIDKRPHPRWARFLLLDYPNATDRYRYARAAEAGTLPEDSSGRADIGGAIGIHGSDRAELNEHGIDWTLGCISLTNEDVIELDALVPVGTPVLIVE